jgi:hypothetical protein
MLLCIAVVVKTIGNGSIEYRNGPKELWLSNVCAESGNSLEASVSVSKFGKGIAWLPLWYCRYIVYDLYKV